MALENLKSIFGPGVVLTDKNTRSIYVDEDSGHFKNHTKHHPTDDPSIIFQTAGNDNLPHKSLAEDGVTLDTSGGWSALYNENHTPHNGSNVFFKPYLYGPNVSRDKLNIRDSNMHSSIFSWSRSPFLGLGQGEPYIVSDIGSTIPNAGSREVPIIRGITDAIRLGLYTSSPAGLQFIARQNALGLFSKSEAPLLQNDGGHANTMVSPQRFNTFYNPLSTLGAAASRLTGTTPNVLIRKDILLPGVLGTQKSYGVGSLTTGGVSYDVNASFTGNKLAIADTSTSFPIAAGVKSKTPGLRSGDAMTLADMITGINLDSTGITTTSTDENGISIGGLNNPLVNVEKVQNGMPFYFKDLRDNTYIFFRAYIEGLTENISPSYAPHNYIGRSEPVWTYERAEREISMTLKLVAQTRDELTAIYKKMDRLTSMCYPEYVNEDEDGYGNRMKPPLAKLRYGELYGKTNKELMGYIKSISYSVDQTSTWETEVGKRVPRHVTATIGYQVIHEKAPRLKDNFKFYGINQ